MPTDPTMATTRIVFGLAYGDGLALLYESAFKLGRSYS
jgi:hypothetical protein